MSADDKKQYQETPAVREVISNAHRTIVRYKTVMLVSRGDWQDVVDRCNGHEKLDNAVACAENVADYRREEAKAVTENVKDVTVQYVIAKETITLETVENL